MNITSVGVHYQGEGFPFLSLMLECSYCSLSELCDFRRGPDIFFEKDVMVEQVDWSARGGITM